MTSKKLLATHPDASASVTAVLAMPVGTVVCYYGTAAPNGWLLCNGQGITAETYPALHILLGDTVPDLRSRFVVGAGQADGFANRWLGSTGGEENHQLLVGELPEHAHGFGVGGGHGFEGIGSGISDGWSKNYQDCTYKNHTIIEGQNHPHNNMPPFYALTYIIKY